MKRKSGLREEKKSTKEKFRLHTKSLFLTYSRCPESWTKEFVKKRLVEEILVHQRGGEKYKTKVKSWVVAREDHQDPIGSGDYERGIHFHCLLELGKETDIKDANVLDLQDEKGVVVHGNYQAVKNMWDVLNYVKKHGDWIGEGFPGMGSKERAIMQAGTQMEAKQIAMPEMSTRDKLAFREEYYEVQLNLEETKKMTMRIPKMGFHGDLEPYMRQLIGKGMPGLNLKGRPMGFLMYGESGSGKSSWMYHLAHLLGETCTSLYDMSSITASYRGETIVMLDEFKGEDFETYAEEIKLMITDPKYRTPRYHDRRKMAENRRVLIGTNEDVKLWKWKPGLKERLMLIEVKANGEYQMQMWLGNTLIDKTLEEAMEYLGFSIGGAEEIGVKELEEMRRENLLSK